MAKVISCINEKGGVAKTTTAKNLAAGLALKDFKVLIIDLDPSANLTKSLGYYADKNDTTIRDILKKYSDGEEVEPTAGIEHIDEEGFDLIMSSYNLHSFVLELASAQMREVILQTYIDDIKDNYDYIIIDCPGGLDILVTNALYASDYIIVPLEPQYLSIDAVQNLFIEIYKARKFSKRGGKPEILGLLFAKVRDYTKNDKEIMETIRQNYSEKMNVFKTQIPVSVKIPESDKNQMSIFRFAPKTTAAMSYADFVDEVLDDINGKENNNG